ncbi:AraC family transcriptional regulator [Parapedobacter indicus]|uniref:AraC-type DNA-binding protein n=1 Tax=Parapedobacter indicus TaxID=1477437 RepID=A0A1I3SGR2_9SPHI|nr:AraC family transcriptional regulator [Parapedobacter indicus]PPK99853.1 AraC-like DNA-binding protein [Parapedobacter indicus]SFJ56646.1 AraC-type DNA-binding protein [Parapedobacter indicus]
MKPLLKIINKEQQDVFQLMRVCEPHFFPALHFHPECEIMLVLKGTGIRFVGDSMERFQPGDLVFYGRDIPHFYRNDRSFYQQVSDSAAQAIVIYFREDFLGKEFWELPKNIQLKKLFTNSKRGIKFTGKSKTELERQIKRLDDHKDSLAKLIDLLSILQVMANSKECELLSSRGFVLPIEENECKRMNDVYQHIINHYVSNPSLEEVSAIANMSPSAFCRYFKQHSNKTYTQFLNEIKIGNACKLLIDNKLPISQICFEVGFNNFTHFNGQFRRIIGVTPSQYQRQHLSMS